MKPRVFLLLVFLVILSFRAFCSDPSPEVSSEGLESFISKTLFIDGFAVTESSLGGIPLVVTIPLKRAGKLFMIEATIDKETGNFLFDTGSQHLLLNSIYFRKYMTGNVISAGGSTGAVGKVTQTRIRQLDISGIKNDNIAADIADLGHLENRRGVKIFGLFGFAMMKNMEVVIDAPHSQLRIYRLDRNGRRLSTTDTEFRTDLTQKAELYNDVIFLQATIAGKALCFCFDTGAESNVLSNWLPKKIMSTVTITSQSNMNGVGTASEDVLYGKLNDFTLSSHSMPGMPVIITSLENMSEAFDHNLDGMLGFDFLNQGIISVNLMTKEFRMAFTKGAKP